MLAASCARYGLPQRPQWLEELLTARSFLYRRVLSMTEEGATEKQTYGVEAINMACTDQDQCERGVIVSTVVLPWSGVRVTPECRVSDSDVLQVKSAIVAWLMSGH